MTFKVGDKVNFYDASLNIPTKLIITEIKDNGILKGKCIINGDLWLANPKQCRKLVKKWEIGNRGKFINKQSDWFGKKFTVIKSYKNSVEVNFDNTKNNPYTILKRFCRKLIKKKIDLKIGDRFIYVKSKNKIEIINLDYPVITYQRQENSETDLIGIETFKEELRNGIIKRLRKKRLQWNPGDRGIITYSGDKFTTIKSDYNYENAYLLKIQKDDCITQHTIGSMHCKKLKKKGRLISPEIVSSNEAIKKAFEYMTANKKIRRSSDDLIMQDCGDPFKWNLETDKYGVMNFKTCWKCGNFFTNEHPSSNEILATDPPKYQHSECPKVKTTEKIKVTHDKVDYEILHRGPVTFQFPEPKNEIIEDLKKTYAYFYAEKDNYIKKLELKLEDSRQHLYLEQIECILCNSTGMFVNLMEGTYKKCPSCKGTKKLWRKK